MDGTKEGGDGGAGPFERGGLRMDADARAARLKGLEAYEAEGEEVAGCGSPGVIPVLVGFKGVVPGFEGEGGTDAQHVVPTAKAVGGQQAQGIIGLPGLVQGIQQELGPINAAGHAARTDKGYHALLPLGRDQSEQQREHIGVQGCVGGPDAIDIDPASGII